MFMKTHCKWGHPLTPENTYTWRSDSYCKVCRRVREKLRKRGTEQSFSDHLKELTERGTLYKRQRGPLGRVRNELAAQETPTPCDLAWAAGIYEGEGACSDLHAVSVTQKDTWLLYRLKSKFGGKVALNYSNGCSRWVATGSRARGFLMTIFLFLSPKRKLQALSFLGQTRSGAWRALRRKYPVELSRPR
jgi:hypothetical protein